MKSTLFCDRQQTYAFVRNMNIDWFRVLIAGMISDCAAMNQNFNMVSSLDDNSNSTKEM